MLVLWTFLGSLAAAIVFLFTFRGILDSEALQRTNYRGVRLPTGAGIIFVPSFLMVWIVAQVYYVGNRETWSSKAVAGHFGLGPGMNVMLVLVLGMCLIGLLDDFAGDRRTRGFKGHFSEALKGRLTTGFLKAVLGFMVALVALFPQYIFVGRLSFQDYGKWLIGAAVIALAANLFNLLDRRPGSALKVFFPVLALCFGLTLRYEAVGPRIPYPSLSFYVAPAVAFAAVALVLFSGDLREKFMMGDAGSNVIGRRDRPRAGVGDQLLVASRGVRSPAGFEHLSEKFSFSRIIASNRALNWIDSLGRKDRRPLWANNY